MLKTNLKKIISNNRLNSQTIPKMSSNFSTNSNIIGYAEDDVLFSNKNMARLVTLNRPKKLNSLNTSMVSKIGPRLLEYAKSNVSNVIILNSTSPKGLCAGGDVTEVATQIKKGNPEYASDFFQREYNLNYMISTYPKPYIALMDGITMGGGVGLSVHAPFRVATETTKLTMPEMDIGFFPDVGTTFFLPRLDDKLGYYVAFTGRLLSGLDAYMLGFATHYVPSDRLDALVNRLSNLQPPTVNDNKVQDNHSSILNNSKEFYAQVNQAIEEFTENKLPEDYKFPFTTEELELINKAFSQSSVEEILSYLQKDGSEFALKTYETMISKPPTSLKVAFELLKRGEQNTIRQQFELELITGTNLVHIKPESNEFAKGVTHKLIDKIKEPPLPDWILARQPSGISDDFIKKNLEKSIHTTKLNEPLIDKLFGINYRYYPYNMGLPTNKEIENFITGNDGSGRSYLPTPTEVLKHFKQSTNNKVGVELKVQSSLDVHGKASRYDNKYVTWVK